MVIPVLRLRVGPPWFFACGLFEDLESSYKGSILTVQGLRQGLPVQYFGGYSRIGRMVRDLNVPVRLRVCPIVRDADGLALHSRNRYLDAGQRQNVRMSVCRQTSIRSKES